MNIKKAMAYETVCPSCLSVIQFESHEIWMGGYDSVGTIVCPECHYRIEVKDKASTYGCASIFRNNIKPIYETKEQIEKRIRAIVSNQ